MIIETGFNLHFLKNIFQEANTGETGDGFDKVDTAPKEKSVINDNIVSQWVQLLFGLFKSGISTVKSKL